MDNHILFLGEIPYENISLFYNACDVFVLPSMMEGCPTTVLEAMASAKPVVALNIEGCRDLIRDGINGFLVPLADKEALAERIIRLLTENQLAIQMGKEGRKMVETKYTWETIAKKTLDLYAHVCNVA